jgi:pimeloyl-ACP methyl ester carboxylesterase
VGLTVFKRLRRAIACRIALHSPRGLILLQCATPLASLEYPGRRPQERLIIFLPGIGDLAEDFAARGFIDSIAQSGLPADAVAVDAHYGYYARRSVIDRLAHDVVLPARKRGYRDIWLVGISMGGLGALSYAIQHPEHVDRVIPLAPYLGEPAIGDAAEHIRKLWQCIDSDEAVRRKLYIGYGMHDRFARSNALVAARLSSERVVALPGGHDWRTWKRLWETFLSRYG